LTAKCASPRFLRLAEAVGKDASLVRRHLGLTSLRPDLIRQILAGDEPDGLSLRELLRGVVERWEEQPELRAC